jgi:hypothetical protein
MIARIIVLVSVLTTVSAAVVLPTATAPSSKPFSRPERGGSKEFPKLMKTYSGRSIALSCKTSRIAAVERKFLRAVWFKDERPLTAESERRFEAYKVKKRKLEIENAQQLDTGMYHCEARRDKVGGDGKAVYTIFYDVDVVHRTTGEPLTVSKGMPGNQVNIFRKV